MCISVSTAWARFCGGLPCFFSPALLNFWHVVAADRAQASNEASSQKIPVQLTAPKRLTQAAILPVEVLVLLTQLAVLLAQLAVLDFQPCWRSCSSPFILMYSSTARSLE